MDLISCRNVLIYMQPYLQKKALTTFHYALRPKGYLMLGKSETISSVPELFQAAEKKNRIFVRKDKPGKFMQVASKRREENIREFSKPARTQNARTDFQKAADELVLNKYTPTGVVIDEAMDIVHFRGRPGFFLEPHAGKASLNLLKMAKPGLAFELRSLVHHAKKLGRSVIKKDIPMEDHNTTQLVSIEAMPLPDLTDPHYLVLFHAGGEEPSSLRKGSRISENLPEGTDNKELQIEQLKKELAQAREDMNSITEDQEATNEELQSANEELQSSSEELQSLNEELETSKEELQSTNEELISVNQELVSLNRNITAARNFAVDVLETIREPWVVLDKKFRIKSHNNSFHQMFNPEKVKLQDVPFFEMNGVQWDQRELQDLFDKIISERLNVTDYEISIDMPLSGRRTLLLNAKEVIREDEGEKLILLVFGDVTEKRKAEKNLEKSEGRFKLLTETLPQLIWVTDANGRFEYFNPQLKEYTGITSGEILEEQWSTFVHPDDMVKVLRKWKKCLSSGKAFNMEHRLRAKDGTYNWFLAKALPTFGSDKQIISWFGSYTNIELQKDAQSALRKSSEHFRQLAELIPEKIFHADVNGKVDYLNKSWMNYSGLTEEELQGDGWTSLLHPDDKDLAESLWKESISFGKDFEMELRFLDRNGDYKWHLGRAIPVRDEAGNIQQWIGSTTEVHRMKEEEKRKEGFLKLVSHELKTPVTSIKGYVQLLLSLLKEDKNIPVSSLPLKVSLVRMDVQIARLTRLISEMLDLSRIEDNRLSLRKVNFNLNELVESTVQDLNIQR